MDSFPTLEEGMKHKDNYQWEGIKIGPVRALRAEGDEYLDDAKGCSPSEEAALNHLKEISFSHCSEPTDTEGHSYDCAHCGIHYYIYGGNNS